MRRSLPLLVLLLATDRLRPAAAAATASRRPRARAPTESTMAPPTASAAALDAAADAAAERAAAGPDVAPTAAPGVAFNYRYAFRLPAERIAEVQEQHAAVCERLGVARCRITGMLYRVVNDRRHRGDARVQARSGDRPPFGREGVGAVVRRRRHADRKRDHRHRRRQRDPRAPAAASPS